MGRRKIEIRAIKDDRNRSVTFLKRKGGLFKKAHELSVLCSVDVAVIIFGHNKKLYEFSSGDIQETLQRYQYYGQPHEHKGPADFKNKSGGDDDDEDEEDEEMGNNREDSLPPPSQVMPPHLPHHNSFTHLRQPTASVSPPMPNGIFQRHSTPQAGPPPQVLSRPSSRNTIRRTSSNLVPIQHPHPTPPPSQNGFAYMPNPSVYNPNAAAPAPPPPPPPPPQRSPQPPFQQFPPHTQAGPPPSSHAPMSQAHQPYLPEQRQPPQPSISLQPPGQSVIHHSPKPEPQALRPVESSPPRARHMSSKSHSIFTPIDEGGSVLANFFGGRADTTFRAEVKREGSPGGRPAPVAGAPRSVPPSASSQSTAPEFAAPSRSSTSGSRSAAPRPKLNLQIPSEASDGESATVDSSPHPSGGTKSTTPAKSTSEVPHPGIVLPPPSPSASAVLSAGASGPPNPFARPAPPPTSGGPNSNAYADNKNSMDTPMSALPSRFIADNLLPSPGGFYDWDNFGKSGLNSAILPSPLTFPTPTNNSPSFERSGPAAGEHVGEKRKGSDESMGEAKKLKT